MASIWQKILKLIGFEAKPSQNRPRQSQSGFDYNISPKTNLSKSNKTKRGASQDLYARGYNPKPTSNLGRALYLLNDKKPPPTDNKSKSFSEEEIYRDLDAVKRMLVVGTDLTDQQAAAIELLSKDLKRLHKIDIWLAANIKLMQILVNHDKFKLKPIVNVPRLLDPTNWHTILPNDINDKAQLNLLSDRMQILEVILQHELGQLETDFLLTENHPKLFASREIPLKQTSELIDLMWQLMDAAVSQDDQEEKLSLFEFLMAVFTCSDKINQALIQKGQSYNVNPIQKEADQGAAATTINLCPPLKAKTEEIVLSTTNIAVLLKRMLINDADAVKDLLSNKSFWDCIDKREAKNFELNQLFTNHEQLLMGLNTEEQKHKENLSLPSDLFELIEDLDVISVEEFYPNATESS